MIKTFSIRVSGRVQGVFYRASAKNKADELGVAGFVQNEHDGSVYMEAEADEDVLDDFVHWCKSGPERASVNACVVEEIAFKNFRSFEIRR